MSHLVFKNNKESEQKLEFCTEKEFCVIDIIKSTDFHNAEMKFEKLPEKYLVEKVTTLKSKTHLRQCPTFN